MNISFFKNNDLRRARKAAKKFDLDFVHLCCFPHQINYKGLKNGKGEIVEVPMESGKVGLYKVSSSQFPCASSDPPDQRNWKFKFQGYKEIQNNND